MQSHSLSSSLTTFSLSLCFFFWCGPPFALLRLHSDVTSTLLQTASLFAVSMCVCVRLQLFLSSSLPLFPLLLPLPSPCLSALTLSLVPSLCLLTLLPCFSTPHSTSSPSSSFFFTFAFLPSSPDSSLAIFSSWHVCQFQWSGSLWWCRDGWIMEGRRNGGPKGQMHHARINGGRMERHLIFSRWGSHECSYNL